jgi:L-ascorbate metabolism protein UlaG (beta-lactamase superfamily)
MKRAIATFSLFLAIATLAPAAEEKKLTIRYHGQSFFEIVSSKGTRIVIDPHAIEEFGRKTVKADVVLMSHLHSDHTQTSVVENIKSAKVFNALKIDKNGDFPRQEYNPIDEKFKDVKIHSMGTYHDAMSGMLRGKNGVFIIDVDGLRIVHLGDLGHSLSDDQLKVLGEVDILMVPVGGVYTLNGLTAAKVVEQIKPKRYIIPMHYGTPRYDYLLLPNTFLEEMKKESITKLTVNQLVIDANAKAPEEPHVMLMHWGAIGDK